MKLITKILACTTVLFLLAGCKENLSKGSGKLVVNTNLTLGTLQVPPGTYKASYKVESKKLLLKLTVGKKTHDVTIKIPKIKDLPSLNEFKISGAQIGQSFDITGHDTYSSIPTGAVTTQNRQCVYSTEEYETNCSDQLVADYGNDMMCGTSLQSESDKCGYHTEEVCDTETSTTWGKHNVTFNPQKTTHTKGIYLKSIQTLGTIAYLDLGTNVYDSENIIESTDCLMNLN